MTFSHPCIIPLCTKISQYYSCVQISGHGPLFGCLHMALNYILTAPKVSNYTSSHLYIPMRFILGTDSIASVSDDIFWILINIKSSSWCQRGSLRTRSSVLL